jgi:branched-chain amino acid aminotransferase
MKTKEEVKLWLNGKFINESEFRIGFRDHVFHYGSGVFEGIRAYETIHGTAIFGLQKHIDRLYASAKGAHLKIPFTYEEIFNACIDVVKINKFDKCYIRPIVYLGGQKSLGLKLDSDDAKKIQVAISAWEWDSYSGSEASENGMRVVTSHFRKLSSRSIYDIKGVGNYLLYRVALEDAQEEEAQKGKSCDDIVFLDEDGRVTECSVANIFFVKHYGKKTTLVTPSLNSAILSGITRDVAIKIAWSMKYAVNEKRFPMQELLDNAEEAFTTGTATGIRAIGEIDHETIGDGKTGKITEKLQKEIPAFAHFGKIGKRREKLMSKKGECFKQIDQLRNTVNELRKIVKAQAKKIKDQDEYIKAQIEPRIKK